MRVTLVLLISLLTACSSEALRCEKHLTPINPPQKLLGDASRVRAVPLEKTAKKVEVQNSSGKSQAQPPAGAGGTP